MSSKYLSDHKPFILDDILVWNMLTKAVTTEKRTNNGFGWHESDHAYQLRLKNIIHAIGGWVAVHHLNFLALQECPKTPSWGFWPHPSGVAPLPRVAWQRQRQSWRNLYLWSNTPLWAFEAAFRSSLSGSSTTRCEFGLYFLFLLSIR